MDPDAIAAAIGPLLQRVRLNDGHPLTDVAQRAGIAEHSLARYERGQQLAAAVFLRWCAALDLTPVHVIDAATAVANYLEAPPVPAPRHAGRRVVTRRDRSAAR